MYAGGLGGSQFGTFAKAHTQLYTTGPLVSDIVRGQEGTTRTLYHFFTMVNHFNADYFQFLQPNTFPYPLPDT